MLLILIVRGCYWEWHCDETWKPVGFALSVVLVWSVLVIDQQLIRLDWRCGGRIYRSWNDVLLSFLAVLRSS